ncbi:hypothetical protein, partial [Thermolongibacillus altinsuensis]|uniref:hypothetical protein n=1 Tax=Thermolongibacillus altinsuensis TaxID=575256 RepID=UPI002553E884
FGDLVVTSGVSALGKLGMGVAGMALIGAGISGVATWVAQRAEHSPDLLPEGRPAPPARPAASRAS